ncbi:alpha/beta hydrolase [Streptomyces sp. NRRL S-495]|uniref:alpha/beta fold hydrolase n=1 Tax=Streptomyces sp. NRRL S-495 TaxID=1609133 RepID=UPI0006974273
MPSISSRSWPGSGPVVLVGHSYGGAVTSNAAVGRENVKALVFVAAFVPEAGESIGELSGRYRAPPLGGTIEPGKPPDGTADLYIAQDRYRRQFAAGLGVEQAALDAVAECPLRDVALDEASGEDMVRSSLRP